MEYRTEELILRSVTEDEIAEVARTWPSEHGSVTKIRAAAEILKMARSSEKNRPGCISNLTLAVCRADAPQLIIGWCGLDGSMSTKEPEIFVMLDRYHQGKGYGTLCFKALLKIAEEEYALKSVHGGCLKDNTAAQRAMEKAGMIPCTRGKNANPQYRYRCAGR